MRSSGRGWALNSPTRREMETETGRFRALALAILISVFAYRSILLVSNVIHDVPLGTDFSCFWAGARVSLSDPSRIYDFRHVTQVQGWPLGRQLRPFIYPPSALLFYLPFGSLPLKASYALFVAATGAVFLLANRRAGAPWWTVSLPVVWLVAACGQVTLLIVGLVLLALTLRQQPAVAGLLLGAAAALKPQLCLLLPLGLVADRRWSTLMVAAAAALAFGLISAATWGPHIWQDWIEAVGRFQREVLPGIPGIEIDELTPYAALERLGLPGAIAFMFAPLSCWLTWRAFRDSGDPLVHASAAFGGLLLVSPYAMNYDAAVLAPGVAALLARREDRLWPLFATLAMLFAVSTVSGPGALVAGLAPAAVAVWRGRGRFVQSGRWA